MKKNPTIDDVAALSGVARTTVSRVLNNGPNVRDELRRRVMDAVKQLDYRVNEQARSLASGKTRQLAVFYASDFDTEPNSYYSSAIEIGVLRKCAQLGYQAFSHTINLNSENYHARIESICRNNKYEGAILTPPFSDDIILIKKLNEIPISLVAISSGPEAQKFIDSVGMDDEAAGYQLTETLIKAGYHDFGFILGLENHISAELRFRGFEKALKDNGISFDNANIMRGNFTFKSGVEASTKIFDNPNPPQVLICANDDMAAGALFNTHRRNIKVPEQIAITGFDDTPVSEILWPPLTTVHQPLKKIGAAAVNRIIENIKSGTDKKSKINQMIDFTITMRESTKMAKI